MPDPGATIQWQTRLRDLALQALRTDSRLRNWERLREELFERAEANPERLSPFK